VVNAFSQAVQLITPLVFVEKNESLQVKVTAADEHVLAPVPVH